jgi:hypothetical protein
MAQKNIDLSGGQTNWKRPEALASLKAHKLPVISIDSIATLIACQNLSFPAGPGLPGKGQSLF